jgi:hypothetical protein
MEKLSTRGAFRRHARPILAGVALGLTLIWAQNVLANPLQPTEIITEDIAKEADTCTRAIALQERRQGIPAGLLKAISHAESGRWDAQNREILAWPWTVTTGGKGYFLPNRVDAVAFVESLQAEGVENIDVGCMQINLKYHPEAFNSIEDAFDPHANAQYAADFLRERFAVSKSWLQAAGDYHSTTAARNKTYRDKVAKLWKDTQKDTTAASTTVDSAKPRAKTNVTTAVTATTGAAMQLAATTLPPPDASLTKRFNESFRARSTPGGMTNTGQTLTNRLNALKPGAHLNGGSADSFAQKRQMQLMAWRQDNGFPKPSAEPMPRPGSLSQAIGQ